MSMFRTVLVYLGLGSDEEYDDGYRYDDDGADDRGGRPTYGAVSSPGGRTNGGDPLGGGRMTPADRDDEPTVSAVRPLRPVPDLDDDEGGVSAVRPISGGASSADGADPVAEVIRPVAASRAKPRSLSPQSFGDAKVVADDFRKQVPVVMNLIGVERELERRLIDFSSGLCYGLGGSMDKLAPHVYLLVPKSVTVSDDDRRRLEERGFER